MLELLLAVVVLAAIAAVLFVVIATRTAARVRYEAKDRETVLVPLAAPGHHAALIHHPPASAPRTAPPVIVCHGMGVNSLCMDALDDGTGSPRLSMVRALANAGFDVWALELRGRGKAIVPKRARWTVDDEVGEDVPKAIAAVLAKTGAAEVWWVGHSKGAMVQLLFQSTGHALADKVTALVAIGTPGTVVFQRPLLKWAVPALRAMSGVIGDVPLSKLMPLLVPLAGVARFLGRPVDTLLYENDARSLARLFASIFADVNRGVLDQMLRWVWRRDGALTSMKGEKYEDGYHKLAMPMLLLAGAKDRLAPPESVAWVRDRVSSKDLTMEVIGVASGASHDYGHGDLVLGKRAPEEVFARVIKWLGDRSSA